MIHVDPLLVLVLFKRKPHGITWESLVVARAGGDVCCEEYWDPKGPYFSLRNQTTKVSF